MTSPWCCLFQSLLALSFTFFSTGEETKSNNEINHPPRYTRWPHMLADQVRGLSFREIGGGFSRHHRAPSIRAACFAIAKPSTLIKTMKKRTRVRGHRYAVYCGKCWHIDSLFFI